MIELRSELGLAQKPPGSLVAGRPPPAQHFHHDIARQGLLAGAIDDAVSALAELLANYEIAYLPTCERCSIAVVFPLVRRRGCWLVGPHLIRE